MEEPSLLSSGEISDSNSSIHQHPTQNPNASPASKFKGVVSQPNGHWGAQIYANHQRIWLGTFKSEKEAATAYDSAAIKLRNGYSHRNLPWTEITVHEPSFQNNFTTETILTMIKDGSYFSKFSDYLLRAENRPGSHSGAGICNPGPGVKLRQLFLKELTPSDVSKLNRLVIPKKYAVKYFPRICHDFKEGININITVDDLELMFFDRSMRSWKFRYCYWKSSQSFVFTRGWNRFAKEKGLRPLDRVIFSSYECGDQKLCIIDVAYNDGRGVKSDGTELEKINLQRDFERGGDDDYDDEENACAYEEMKENVPVFQDNHARKGFKLFGVQII